MLLTIQSDESLQSYVDRNIFLNWQNSTAGFFKPFSKSVLLFSEMRTIASAMGWYGCQGFNRLLHFHTDYPRSSVFKRVDNLSYSQDAYLRKDKCNETKRRPSAFCPECIREDMISFGFSYWRRSHQTDIKICVKHNVVLQRYCPFCDMPFTRMGHGLEVMWNGCEGRSLATITAVSNQDSVEYKRSTLLRDVYSFGHHVSEEAALLLLHEKLSSMSHPGLFVSTTGDTAVNLLNITVLLMKEQKFSDHFESKFQGLVFEAILLAYDSFSSFMSDLKSSSVFLRSTDTLWSTYQVLGTKSVKFLVD